MEIRLLKDEHVRQALPMARAIEVMKTAFARYSGGEAIMPLRSRLESPQGITLLMPAFLEGRGDLSVKIVSVFGENPARGLPVVSALVVCLDPETGRLRALMEGDALTAIRTGAAGGLAAELLARANARTVVLFGAGVQGRAQLEAVMTVRKIELVHILDPAAAKARDLAETVRALAEPPEVRTGTGVREAVSQADIILAATTATTPLFDGRWLQPGTHVTGVGSFTPEMQEIDAHTMARATVVVDSRSACLAETGDIMAARPVVHAEIGEIVSGAKPGRTDEREITVFKAVGLAVQDAAAAGAILEAAAKHDLGLRIPW